MRHCFALVVLLAMVSGCDSRAPSTGSTTSPQAGSSGSTTVNWNAVTPAEPMQATNAICRLSRLADFCTKAGVKPVRLTFKDGKAVDPKGTSCAVTPEEWKGVVGLCEKGGPQGTASRALPAGANNYQDGRGSVKRHAYGVSKEADDMLVFTEIKPLDDDSNG